MQPIIIYAAIIVVTMGLVKVIVQKATKLLSQIFDSISNSATTIVILIGIILLALAYTHPAEAAEIYQALRGLINNAV